MLYIIYICVLREREEEGEDGWKGWCPEKMRRIIFVEQK